MKLWHVEKERKEERKRNILNHRYYRVWWLMADLFLFKSSHFANESASIHILSLTPPNWHLISAWKREDRKIKTYSGLWLDHWWLKFKSLKENITKPIFRQMTVIWVGHHIHTTCATKSITKVNKMSLWILWMLEMHLFININVSSYHAIFIYIHIYSASLL